MSRSSGTILDSSAIIDFHWLREWDWLAGEYGPLYVSTELVSSDALGKPERSSAEAHLSPLAVDSESGFHTIERLRQEEPGLSLADRATVALALHHSLRCMSDDAHLVTVCRKRGLLVVRTLAVLSAMVDSGHKPAAEVIRLARGLVQNRGKWISPQVLRAWEASLDR